MKNKLLAFVLLIFSIAAIYSSFKIFKSASYQTFLMWDFNNETHETPYEIYAQKLDANYPNLTFTSLPMKYIQSKYFIHEDSINKAKLQIDARKWKAGSYNSQFKAGNSNDVKVNITTQDLHLEALKLNK